MTCIYLGDVKAFLVESSRSGEGKSTLYECRCEAALVELTHPRHVRTGAVVVEREGQRTSEQIASCHGCPFRVEAEKPKPSLAERVGQKRAERNQEWEAYLAAMANMPGTILHGIVKSKGHGISTDCKCKAMIRRMNAGGSDWCVEHEEEIVDVMVAEAKRRKVKWPDVVLRLQARRWVRQAVREARQQADTHANHPPARG